MSLNVWRDHDHAHIIARMTADAAAQFMDDANQLDRLQTALADRYQIKRQLGSGGMASVYLAGDLKHHRDLAIKVLKPELAAALGPERFLREIEIVARLNHPHILALIDSGEAGPFL